jgi:hypothetical protein
MSTISAPTSERQPTSQDFRLYKATVWRVVEAQHRISTNRLAANAEDQSLLEILVERVKPPLPGSARGLHYLLSTPFRYGHSRASRFRHAGERPGIFYASEHIATAVAEAAWWRLYFLSRSPGLEPPRTTIEHSAFTVVINAARALDLTAPPFVQAASLWMAADDYAPCQRFASAARSIETQLIRYSSVRDPPRRANIALLDPGAFAGETLRIKQSWHFRLEHGRLTAFAAFPGEERYSFGMDDLTPRSSKV